ncbi:hypothetical protein PHISP_01546 [Aspergillus sp. HF37]|nr:hypothetical protein PHISP_01546 [Aspergillus sp. HF37]
MCSKPKSMDSILSQLPPGTNQYSYRSLRDFESILRSEGAHLQLPEPKVSQFILFTEIDTQTFARDFENPVRDIVCHIIDSYYPFQGALVIKMKTGAHEAAHATFNKRLLRKLASMGSADDDLLGIGAKTISSTSRSKEADLAYRPLELPDGRSKQWPTLALESGYSNSNDLLESNARWWISESGGDVKVAVTIDIHKQRREVNVRIYGLQHDETIEEQHATVSQQQQGQSAHVNNAPLIISFHGLFLRDPTGDERDIEFDDDDMRHLGRAIWNEQF